MSIAYALNFHHDITYDFLFYIFQIQESALASPFRFLQFLPLLFFPAAFVHPRIFRFSFFLIESNYQTALCILCPIKAGLYHCPVTIASFHFRYNRLMQILYLNQSDLRCYYSHCRYRHNKHQKAQYTISLSVPHFSSTARLHFSLSYPGRLQKRQHK